DLPRAVREDRPAAQGRPRDGRDAVRDLRLPRQRLPDRARRRPERAALPRARGARAAGLPSALLRHASLHRVRASRRGDPTRRSTLPGLIALALLAQPAHARPLSLRCEPAAVVPAVRGVVAVERTHRDAAGLPTVFAVTAIRNTRTCRPASFRVQIPVRPNGATRWVNARAVRVLWVDTRIVIHVKSARLELLRAGRVVLRTP